MLLITAEPENNHVFFSIKVIRVIGVFISVVAFKQELCQICQNVTNLSLNRKCLKVLDLPHHLCVKCTVYLSNPVWSSCLHCGFGALGVSDSENPSVIAY